MTYLFYDLETSGLNKAFDQVFQFAAIRTDRHLQELDRYEINIRLNPDVLPAPEALITHQIPFSQLLEGTSEYEAIKTIYGLMNEPGTCSIGYNTLGFDDEFLRFSFYRHLLPPYRHQYANGCSRMDCYPMLPFYYLYHPDSLSWPSVDDKLSLKLEVLNEANGWVSGQAHNALVDVEATLALARVLSQRSDQWQYVIKYFDKATDQLRGQQLPVALSSALGSHHVGLYIDTGLGVARQFQTQVLSLGQHQQYRNQQLYLCLDNPELSTQLLNQDFDAIRYIRKKAAEPGFLLPPSKRFIKIDADRLALIHNNLAWLADNVKSVEQIAKHLCQQPYPDIAGLDPQANLYQGGFFSRFDEALFEKFHQLEPARQVGLLERFESDHSRQLALRLIGRYDSSVLSPSDESLWQDYLNSVWHDEPVTSRIDYRGQVQPTRQAILARTNALLQDASMSANQQKILEDYLVYLNDKS